LDRDGCDDSHGERNLSSSAIDKKQERLEDTLDFAAILFGTLAAIAAMQAKDLEAASVAIVLFGICFILLSRRIAALLSSARAKSSLPPGLRMVGVRV